MSVSFSYGNVTTNPLHEPVKLTVPMLPTLVLLFCWSSVVLV